ncbi:TlpA disulfide reductase family protein [Mucilaginibacter sp. PAMB04274]|uniref:peroxiredoxin family protein n=1 Tax=Mucilaginibacter sp. PAMB04274 TaxID=3138568 RepID=UPI0031F689DF
MKVFSILCMVTMMTVCAYGQDTVRRTYTRTIQSSTRLDTNEVVYNEQGKALHYYQYLRLLNSGEYTVTIKGGMPGDPTAKKFLKRLSVEEQNRQYTMMKKFTIIKSPQLQEGMELDVMPLLQVMKPAELSNKVIVLIFWSAGCPPCTESFADINDFLKQIHNPEELVVLAISRDSKQVAQAKLKEKPLLYAQFLNQASAAYSAYQLNHMPSYVVADKSHIIRYSATGTGQTTLPSFKSTIKAVLQQ